LPVKIPMPNFSCMGGSNNNNKNNEAYGCQVPTEFRQNVLNTSDLTERIKNKDFQTSGTFLK